MNNLSPCRARCALLLLLPVLPAATAQGAGGPEWPHWRGPDRTGISTETAWRVGDDVVPLWQASVGIGYSTVSIADGLLFTQGHEVEGEQDTIYCLDALTGEERWSHTFPAKTMAKYHRGGAQSTPSIDGERLFALNREGNFFCFSTADGEVRWHKDLREEYELKLPQWGFAASPVVLHDRIIVNVGKVLSFDRAGELQWRSEDLGDAYSTPAPFEVDGERRLAVFNGSGLAVLDTETGAVIAQSEWKTRYDVNAATPVLIGDRIFISSGYGRGCSMLAFDGEALETLWANREMCNHMSGCVEVDGHLYGFDEGTLKCLDLEGNVRWAQRGLGKGALVVAGDRLVALTQRGDLVVADVDPEEYREHVRHKVLEGGVQWTTPVVCGGLIYCRNNAGMLVCVDARPDA